MEKNVTVDLEVLSTDESGYVVGLTWTDHTDRLFSGQMRFKFSSLADASFFLTFDLGAIFERHELENFTEGLPETVKVDFDDPSFEELLEEFHFQSCIQEDADLFSDYKIVPPNYEVIDLTDTDFYGKNAPKNDIESIKQAVETAGRPDSFYFIAKESNSNEPILDVHFLTSSDSYIRVAGRWKPINPIEWERMDGTIEWRIKPEFGPEFLDEFDRGGMTVGSGEKYSYPPFDYLQESVQSNSSEMRREGLNDRSDYFHCVIYGDEVHVHRINDQFAPVSSDEFSEFGRDGGYLLVGQEDWLIILPGADWPSTDDFSGVFQDFMNKLPSQKSRNMSCSEWIEFLNQVDRDRFAIDIVPIDIREGDIDSVARNWMSDRLSLASWEIYRGNRM